MSGFLILQLNFSDPSDPRRLTACSHFLGIRNVCHGQFTWPNWSQHVFGMVINPTIIAIHRPSMFGFQEVMRWPGPRTRSPKSMVWWTLVVSAISDDHQFLCWCFESCFSIGKKKIGAWVTCKHNLVLCYAKSGSICQWTSQVRQAFWCLSQPAIFFKFPWS